MTAPLGPGSDTAGGDQVPPTRRGRPPEISLAQIVAAARRQLDRQSSPADLSLRSVATELGVTPMALYRHVQDKDALLEEVAGVLLAERRLPRQPAPDAWREWHRDIALRLFDLIVASPIVAHVYATRPVTSHAAMVRMETSLRILLVAGFDDDAAMEAYSTLHTYTIGFATIAASRRRMQPPGRAEGVRFWSGLYSSLDPAVYPNLQRLAPDLAQFTTRARFQRGLDAILGQLEPTAG